MLVLPSYDKIFSSTIEGIYLFLGLGEAGVGEGSCRQIFRITSWTRYKGCRSWNNIGDMSKKEAKLEPQIDCIIGKIS